MTYVGIDYSLNSPAICVIKDGIKHFHALEHKRCHALLKSGSVILHPNIKPRGFERIIRNNDFIFDILKLYGITDGPINIEGLAYASKGSSILDIAENSGFLKANLHRSGFQVVEIPPPSVKKFACGKGNGTKTMMFNAWMKDVQVDLMSILETDDPEANPLSDIVDSYYIATFKSNQQTP